MDINDYLIDQQGKNWAKLLADWAGIIPESFTMWLVNRFGDVFLVTDDGAVHMLDVGGGSFTRLADSRSKFAELLDAGDNANTWLMIPLVDDCAKAQPPLTATQCYGFKVPPMLGGEYGIENVVPTDLAVHYSFLAQIHKQTRDLPGGTRISIRAKK
jgi:hypothetical protein